MKESNETAQLMEIYLCLLEQGYFYQQLTNIEVNKAIMMMDAAKYYLRIWGWKNGEKTTKNN